VSYIVEYSKYSLLKLQNVTGNVSAERHSKKEVLEQSPFFEKPPSDQLVKKTLFYEFEFSLPCSQGPLANNSHHELD
jgi:hypothetical protein